MEVDNRAKSGIRTWPWVSLNIRARDLAEWTELAKLAGRSRADLMREALEMVGLPYARAIGAKRPAKESA